MADDSKKAPHNVPSGFSATIQTLWQGKLPLKTVFWIYYVLPILGLAVAGAVLPLLAKIFALFRLVWAGFMVRPVFVAAQAYTGPGPWGLAAKIFAILLGLAVVGGVLAGM